MEKETVIDVQEQIKELEATDELEVLSNVEGLTEEQKLAACKKLHAHYQLLAKRSHQEQQAKIQLEWEKLNRAKQNFNMDTEMELRRQKRKMEKSAQLETDLNVNGPPVPLYKPDYVEAERVGTLKGFHQAVVALFRHKVQEPPAVLPNGEENPAPLRTWGHKLGSWVMERSSTKKLGKEWSGFLVPGHELYGRAPTEEAKTGSFGYFDGIIEGAQTVQRRGTGSAE